MERRQRDIIQVIRDNGIAIARLQAALSRPGITPAEILTDLLTVDGAGSLLDADLLDGNEAAAFALTGHNHDASYAAIAHDHDADYADIAHVGAGGTEHADAVAAGAAGFMTGTDKTKLDNIETAATADQTAAEILTALLGVDGAGSLLDADLLDGTQLAALAALAGAAFTGDVTVAGDLTVDGFLVTGPVGTIEVASGVLTPTGSFLQVQGEGSTTDTITSIATSGIPEGADLYIRGPSGGYTVTLADGAGVELDGNVDFAMDSFRDMIHMKLRTGGNWGEISRSNNG